MIVVVRGLLNHASDSIAGQRKLVNVRIGLIEDHKFRTEVKHSLFFFLLRMLPL